MRKENVVAYISFGAGDLVCVCLARARPEAALRARYRYGAPAADGSNEKILLRWRVPTCQPAA